MATTTREAGSAPARLRLLAWLSPAFPVGSFSYSAGLEGAVHEGRVASADDLRDWIGTVLAHGSAWNDAVLFCEAWRLGGAGGDVAEMCALAEALAGSLERHRETTLQGGAFLAAIRNWPGLRVPDFPRQSLAAPSYCVAVGAVAGANGVALDEACAAFLQAYVSNMIQAGIRLSVLGQTDAVGVLAALEPVVLDMTARAATSSLDDLGASAIMAEIVSMRHETQHSRLFRS
jgi:urease accessory protein